MEFVQSGSLGSIWNFRKRFIDSADYKGLLTAIQLFYLCKTADFKRSPAKKVFAQSYQKGVKHKYQWDPTGVGSIEKDGVK